MLIKILFRLQTNRKWLLFSLVPIFFPFLLHAQPTGFKEAKKLFDKGEIKEVSSFFLHLFEQSPGNALFAYYRAACLIELDSINAECKSALEFAVQGDVPVKANFYLGKINHAQENWAEAIAWYTRFIELAEKRELRNSPVQLLLDQAKKQVNPFVFIQEKEKQPVPIVKNNIANMPEEPVEPVAVPVYLLDTLINFQVNPQIRYLKIEQFKNQRSLADYLKGISLQQKIDSLVDHANTLRETYGNAPDAVKINLADQIIGMERESYALSAKMDQYYLNARRKEARLWEKATADEIRAIQERNIFLEDSIYNARELAIRKQLKPNSSMTINELIPDSLMPTIAATPELTQEKVVYKIQIGAYRGTLPEYVDRTFKKLGVLRKIDQYTDERGVTVYTVGELSSYADAIKMQEQVKLEGIKNPSVAAYKNNIRIDIETARKITGQ